MLACVVIAGVGVTACGKKEASPPPPSAIAVTTVTITPQDTPVAFEFVGQTQSSREVEIRARVSGFLEKRVYTEGEQVKTGQTLFLMDRKPFEAALQQAKGELGVQQSRLQVAKVNLDRIRPLAEKNAVSKSELDDAVGREAQARASVISAEGAVRTAELNLSYTTIFSPLTGLSSYAKIQEGSYVTAGPDGLLTYVAQLDPMWVNFSISENEQLRYRDEAQRGLLGLPKDNNFEVELILADGSVFPNKGRISFADPSFSKETGTFLVRAVLANSGGQLRPGQFVKVRVNGATRPNGILVPQQAVQQGAKSHFVWVVDEDGKAEQRVVDVGAWNGENWFINQGLREGEQVVVDGAIRVAPGAPLQVSPYMPPATAAPPTARPAAGLTSIEQEQFTGRAATPAASNATRPVMPAQSSTTPAKSPAN